MWIKYLNKNIEISNFERNKILFFSLDAQIKVYCVILYSHMQHVPQLMHTTSVFLYHLIAEEAKAWFLNIVQNTLFCVFLVKLKCKTLSICVLGGIVHCVFCIPLSVAMYNYGCVCMYLYCPV